MRTKYVPIIDNDLCTGCGRCVDVCTPASLQIILGKAVLVNANSCGSEEHCIPVCQEAAIAMGWLPVQGDDRIGRWQDHVPS